MVIYISMIEFIEFVKTKINEKRSVNRNLNFIQIGAYDGVSFNDVANLTLIPEDKGIFIEPNKNIFDTLKKNKKGFESSSFLNIIPNENFDHEYFYIDQYGGQSTFVNNVFNEKIHIEEKVDFSTVSELFSKYIDFKIDIIFLDCEGYDHDIVKELLKIQKPDILYFESWDTKNLNNNLNSNKFTTREEILEILLKTGYTIKFEPTEENIIAFKK